MIAFTLIFPMIKEKPIENEMTCKTNFLLPWFWRLFYLEVNTLFYQVPHSLIRFLYSYCRIANLPWISPCVLLVWLSMVCISQLCTRQRTSHRNTEEMHLSMAILRWSSCWDDSFMARMNIEWSTLSPRCWKEGNEVQWAQQDDPICCVCSLFNKELLFDGAIKFY